MNTGRKTAEDSESSLSSRVFILEPHKFICSCNLYLYKQVYISLNGTNSKTS